jgi:hypothetical protein
MNNMNVSNEHLLLINILNNMYNDNNRQIQSLSDQNNQIMSVITNILHVPSSSNNQNTNRQQNNRQQNNRQTNREQSNRQQHRPLNLSVIGTGLEGRLCGNYIDAAARDAARDVARDVGRTQSTNIFSNLFQGFFEPILIYPTASQIETATRRVLYRDISTPINNSCPISMDDFNDNETVTIIRHCGHIFNSDELTTWFQSNCRCPVCRYDIRNFNRNTSAIINQERNNSIPDLIHDISGNILSPEDASGNSFQW